MKGREGIGIDLGLDRMTDMKEGGHDLETNTENKKSTKKDQDQHQKKGLDTENIEYLFN